MKNVIFLLKHFFTYDGLNRGQDGLVVAEAQHVCYLRVQEGVDHREYLNNNKVTFSSVFYITGTGTLAKGRSKLRAKNIQNFFTNKVNL